MSEYTFHPGNSNCWKLCDDADGDNADDDDDVDGDDNADDNADDLLLVSIRTCLVLGSIRTQLANKGDRAAWLVTADHGAQ